MEDTRRTQALGAFGKLQRTAKALLARVERGLASAGLTATQFGVLATLLHNGARSQRELSREVLTSPGNMTELIDRLEQRGLVQRARQPSDRRAMQVVLTPAGKALAEPLFARHAGDVAAIMGGLTSEELRQFELLLDKLSGANSG